MFEVILHKFDLVVLTKVIATIEENEATLSLKMHLFQQTLTTGKIFKRHKCCEKYRGNVKGQKRRSYNQNLTRLLQGSSRVLNS